MEIVINFDKENNEYKIYESESQTLLISSNFGEGLSNLNLFLKNSGRLKGILEDETVNYHFDSHTFQEIIKSNLNLLARVNTIPSEFKNSANKFGMPGVPKNINAKTKQNKPEFTRGSKNFQKNQFSGFKNSAFGESYGKFGKYKHKH